MLNIVRISLVLFVSLSYSLYAGCGNCGPGSHDHDHDHEHHDHDTSASVKQNTSVHSFTAKTLTGKDTELSAYKDKVLLVVNTASKCGLTRQYKGLEKLYKTYKARGFEVLGFPCNQFGNQEPGSAEEIKNFCTLNYGVTFPMFSKIDVNGSNAHPLFNHLKANAPSKSGPKDIGWNFTKFLVDGKGTVVKRFEPMTSPASIAADIEALLKK